MKFTIEIIGLQVVSKKLPSTIVRVVMFDKNLRLPFQTTNLDQRIAASRIDKGASLRVASRTGWDGYMYFFEGFGQTEVPFVDSL